MRDEAIRNGNFVILDGFPSAFVNLDQVRKYSYLDDGRVKVWWANGDMEVLAVSGRIATENYFIVPAAPGFELLTYYEPEADETFVVERSPVIAWRIEECQTFDRCSDENPIAISTDSTSAEGHSAVLCPDGRVRIYETKAVPGLFESVGFPAGSE